MKLSKTWKIILISSALFCNKSANAEIHLTECIGAYELTLPGSIEFALFSEDYIVNKDNTYEATFSNGSTATGVRFLPGKYVSVMAAPDPESLSFLKEKVGSAIAKHKQELLGRGRKDIAQAQNFYDLQRPDSFSTRGVATLNHYEWKQGHIYHFIVGQGKFSENVSDLTKFLSEFHVRQPFEEVQGDRICMPYADVKLPFDAERELSVAMLLKDHPEVTVHFKDKLYKVTDYSEPFYGPEHQLTYYWERRNRGDYSKVEYSWPKFESINIDGMKGKATTVTLFRTGGAKDRGYAAYANSEKDGIRREIMLIVTRNSSRASGKPMSTDEFDKLAESIAKSIRRRVQ